MNDCIFLAMTIWGAQISYLAFSIFLLPRIDVASFAMLQCRAPPLQYWVFVSFFEGQLALAHAYILQEARAYRHLQKTRCVLDSSVRTYSVPQEYPAW